MWARIFVSVLLLFFLWLSSTPKFIHWKFIQILFGIREYSKYSLWLRCVRVLKQNWNTETNMRQKIISKRKCEIANEHDLKSQSKKKKIWCINKWILWCFLNVRALLSLCILFEALRLDAIFFSFHSLSCLFRTWIQIKPHSITLKGSTRFLLHIKAKNWSVHLCELLNRFQWISMKNQCKHSPCQMN